MTEGCNKCGHIPCVCPGLRDMALQTREGEKVGEKINYSKEAKIWIKQAKERIKDCELSIKGTKESQVSIKKQREILMRQSEVLNKLIDLNKEQVECINKDLVDLKKNWSKIQ